MVIFYLSDEALNMYPLALNNLTSTSFCFGFRDSCSMGTWFCSNTYSKAAESGDGKGKGQGKQVLQNKIKSYEDLLLLILQDNCMRKGHESPRKPPNCPIFMKESRSTCSLS